MEVDRREDTRGVAGAVGGMMLPRTGVGVGDDGMPGSPEGVRQCAVCRMATAPGGEVEAIEAGGVDAEGSGVERCIVPAEVSTPP